MSICAEPALSAPAEPACEATRWRTSRALLLAIYSIIPISALCAAADYAFLGGWLKAHLPKSPENLFLFLVIFVQPHIIASALTFCDGEYLRHYGRRILPAIILLLGLALLTPALMHARWFFAFYAVATMIHSTGQQLGITRTMGRGFSRSHTIWRWTALLMAVPIYFDIFSVMPMSQEMHHGIKAGVFIVLGIFLIITGFVWRNAQSRIAKSYVLANATGAVTEVVLYAVGYYFFTILISRVIHDLSAFTFYISHDVNRNRGTVKNYAYRMLGFLRIPIYALCPLIAIALAFPLTWYMREDWAYRIWMPLALFHYYTDAFTWKKGAPHREYIAMG